MYFNVFGIILGACYVQHVSSLHLIEHTSESCRLLLCLIRKLEHCRRTHRGGWGCLPQGWVCPQSSLQSLSGWIYLSNHPICPSFLFWNYTIFVNSLNYFENRLINQQMECLSMSVLLCIYNICNLFEFLIQKSMKILNHFSHMHTLSHNCWIRVVIPGCTLHLQHVYRLCLPPDSKSLHWLTLHEQAPSINHSRTLCLCSKACSITDRFIRCQQVMLEREAKTCCFSVASNLFPLNPEVAGLTMNVWLKWLLSGDSSSGWSPVRPGKLLVFITEKVMADGFSLMPPSQGFDEEHHAAD